VPDLDAHFERASSVGATILSEPEEGGAGRQYRVEDVEGHRWMFAQRTA
jgi:PhnB protein